MIKPRNLSPGDRVAIVAPAGALAKDGLDRTLSILQDWGLEVVLGRYVFGQEGYFSGTDEQRLHDLQHALDDPTLAAILFARGGYGTTRILDQLNLDSLQQTPKWLIGFSDLTALHLKLYKAGLLSIHGDVGTTLGRHAGATRALQHLLFNGSSVIVGHAPQRVGESTGTLVGGNLSLVIDAMGTANEIITDKAILFLEEIEEQTYRVDRMFNQLRRAGKLHNLAGLVIGQFSGISDGKTAFGATWQEALLRLIEPYDYPVSFGLPIGHEPDNYPLIHGATYHLKVEDEKSRLSLV